MSHMRILDRKLFVFQSRLILKVCKRSFSSLNTNCCSVYATNKQANPGGSVLHSDLDGTLICSNMKWVFTPRCRINRISLCFKKCEEGENNLAVSCAKTKSEAKLFFFLGKPTKCHEWLPEMIQQFIWFLTNTSSSITVNLYKTYFDFM